MPSLMGDSALARIGTVATASGVGAYLIATAYQGNVQALGSALIKETGYVEFLVALFVIGLFQAYGPTSKITDAVLFVAIAAVLIKVASDAKVTSALQDFANGRVTLFEAFGQIFGV